MSAADNIQPAQFKGHPYERQIENVPISALQRIREYGPHQLRDPSNVPNLAKSISEKGFTDPLIITYGHKDKMASLGEGNHRLAAAASLGMTHAPARVVRFNMELGKGASVPGATPDHGGHVNADLRPSDIGLPVQKK